MMQFQFDASTGDEPAPSLPIVIADESGHMTPTVSAIVDTGADGTVAPIELFRSSGFRPNRQRRRLVTAGRFSEAEVVIGYSVRVRLGEQLFADVDVYASRELNEVIIGRNLLNRLVFRYDGPQHVLEIME